MSQVHTGARRNTDWGKSRNRKNRLTAPVLAHSRRCFSFLLLSSLLVLSFGVIPANAGKPLQYMDIMGTWVSDPPGKVLHCYLDTTLLLKKNGVTSKCYRGNFVFQKGRKPIFFLLINNHRVFCPFLSLKKQVLRIGGDTELAGCWVKKDNNFHGNW